MPSSDKIRPSFQEPLRLWPWITWRTPSTPLISSVDSSIHSRTNLILFKPSTIPRVRQSQPSFTVGLLLLDTISRRALAPSLRIDLLSQDGSKISLSTSPPLRPTTSTNKLMCPTSCISDQSTWEATNKSSSLSGTPVRELSFLSLLTALIAQVMSSKSMIQTLTSGMSPKLTIEFLTSMVPVFTEDLVLIEPAQFRV